MYSGSAPSTPKLFTVSDVQKIRIDRARVNHETYKHLYGIVNDRIRRRAALNHTHLVYRVPPFVTGRPMYAITHAARYLTDKLRRGGFGVTHLEDGLTLYIDWTPRPRTLVSQVSQQDPEKKPQGPKDPKKKSKDTKNVVPTMDRKKIAARLQALKQLI